MLIILIHTLKLDKLLMLQPHLLQVLLQKQQLMIWKMIKLRINRYAKCIMQNERFFTRY